MFKKKKAKYEQITNVNQIKAHLREFILDSQIPNSESISRDLGCPPISDELYEREEDESELRVEQISHLIPLLYGYSSLFSEAFVASIDVPEEMISSENKKSTLAITRAVQAMFEDAMSHLLIGSVSQMVDLGLLELPKRKR